MKILRIGTEVNRSSIGRTMEQLGILVQREGWESIIAYGRAANESSSKIIKIGDNLSVYNHVLQTRLFDRHGLASYYATKSFLKKLDNIRPDLVHLHDIHGYYININLLFQYLSKKNIPVVWTFHDCWAYTGHCAYYTEAGCEKWLTHCESCPLKKSYPSSILIDRSYKNFENKRKLFTSLKNLTIVSVSDWLKSEIEKSFMNNYPITTIHNGIDVNQFRPCGDTSDVAAKYSIPDDKIILLACATAWSENKGFSDYIALSRIIKKNYVIVLVGLPQKMIKQLPSNVIGIPRTDSVDELAKLYSLASIVLNLSKEETFGKTTVEGLACGTPGIVYDVTASPELIDVETGFVIQKGDLQNVCEAVYELESRDIADLQIKCRNRALTLFNQETNYKKYIDLYKSILMSH